MPLDASLKDQLKTHLEKVTHPVELAASLDDGAKSAELLELLGEIASLSDLITVARVDDDERRPSFAINRLGTDVGVRFAGLPMGHELTSLVLALLQVGGHTPKVTDEVVAQVQHLEAELHFETFFSWPTAPTATGRSTRESASPSSAVATRASRPPSTWPASSST